MKARYFLERITVVFLMTWWVECSQVKVATGQNFSAISLDLVADELRAQGSELGASGAVGDSSNNSDNIITFERDNEQVNLTKYELSKRQDFSGKIMEYVVSRSPQSIIFFKDTRTILVPDKLVYASSKRRKLQYYEIDGGDETPNPPKYEPDLLPASSCLTFEEGKGSGSVKVGYSVSLSLTAPLLEGTITLSLTNMAFAYKSSVSAVTSTSFGGSYSCSAVNGTSVRLFYRVGTVEVEPSQRSILFDRRKKILYDGDWMNMKAQKLLMDDSPMYYCGTSDKMDLQCQIPGVEYVDSEGNKFNSIVNG